MIRINLISQTREKPRRRASASTLVGSGQKITVACTLILALAALGVGWWYWSLRKEAGKLDRRHHGGRGRDPRACRRSSSRCGSSRSARPSCSSA